MYDRDGFLDYFSTVVGASANTCATYRSFLSRMDDALGGLDEALSSKGAEALMAWAKDADVEPFSTYRSHARSVLKRYALYRMDKIDGVLASPPDLPDPNAGDADTVIESDANFIREREMQVQVRKQLGAIESGLQAIDGGNEVVVPTGRIDILARDASSKLVVIELKAGKCPAGAIEQLLAYTYDIEDMHGQPARSILIAGAFSDRQRAAGRRADIELKTYSYSLAFAAED